MVKNTLDEKTENVLATIAKLERAKFKEIETLNFEQLCSLIEYNGFNEHFTADNLFWVLRGLDSTNNELKKKLVIKYAEHLKKIDGDVLVLRAINTIIGEDAPQIRQELSQMFQLQDINCFDAHKKIKITIND